MNVKQPWDSQHALDARAVSLLPFRAKAAAAAIVESQRAMDHFATALIDAATRSDVATPPLSIDRLIQRFSKIGNSIVGIRSLLSGGRNECHGDSRDELRTEFRNDYSSIEERQLLEQVISKIGPFDSVDSGLSAELF